MRKSHALWGVLLIFIGVIWILGTTNTVSIDLWGSLTALWPILIIAAGITLFFKKEAHWARVILWVLVFAVIGGYGFYLGYNDNEVMGSNTFEMRDGMSSAKLEVSAMAASLGIGSTDTALAKVDSDMKYNFSGGKNSSIRYYQKVRMLGGQMRKNFTAALNSTIPWDLDLSTGATDGFIDFSDFILNNCNIKAMACDLTITAGNRQDEAKIKISAASANIDINIPAGSGIRIKTRSLNSDVKGNGISLIRNGDGYESANFSSAKKVVIMEISCASSDITVNAR